MLNSTVRLMFLACCALALWSEAAFADATGFYIRESETVFEAIQIIEMPDGQLSGRYESYSLDEKGKLASMSVGLDGSIAKGQLVINFKKSMNTLFTTQSLSGEVKSNALLLIWEGGTGVFQKSKASARNDSLEKLTALGDQIVWAREGKRLENSYQETKATIDDLSSEQSSIHATILEAQAQYDSLIASRAKRERRISTMNAINVSGDVQYKLGVEIYQIESEVYSLNSEVDRLSNELGGKIRSARRTVEQAGEFCAKSGEIAKEIEFCAELSKTSHTLDALHSDLDSLFRDWYNHTK